MAQQPVGLSSLPNIFSREHTMDTMTSTEAMNGAKSLTASGHASASALMRCSQIWAEGCKKLGEIMAATAQSNLDQTASAWEAMGKVKTLQEAAEVQTGYARAVTEQSLAGAKHLMEATNQLAKEAMFPITEQISHFGPTLRGN